MPSSCETKILNTQPVCWQRVVHTFTQREEKFVFRPLDEDDIAKVAELYRRYYSHLYMTTRHDFHDENFYRAEVALLSNWTEDAAKKLFFIGVIERVANKEIVMAFGAVRDRYDRVVQSLAVVVKPEHRGQHITRHYSRYMDELFESSGADCVWGTIDAKDVAAQRISLHTGCQVGGFMPGVFRWSFDRQTYYRDMLIYFYKYYNGAEKYSTKPADWVVDRTCYEKIQELLQQVTPQDS